MLKRSVPAVLALLAMGMLASAFVPPPEPPSPLRVSIAIPIHRGMRALPIGPGTRFHVVVTNTSDKPQRLWREWCSWGYYNLSFVLKDADGRSIPLQKKVRGWTKNYPDWFELPPGEHYVIETQLSDAQWNMPAKAGEAGKWQILALFHVEQDDAAKEHGVWTGRIVSPVQTYVVLDGR